MRKRLCYPAILLIAVWMVLLVAVVGCGSGEKAEKAEKASDEAASMSKSAGETMEKTEGTVVMLANPEPGIDPVCKMELSDHPIIIEMDGKKYGFCSQQCADKFKENPEKYLKPSEESQETEEHGE